jgi:hypothetical protein
LSPLEAVLGVTAVLAGLTGAWSPCGFSMVDTLAAAAREHGRGVLPPACASFSLGCVVGGALTFGGLAGAGALLRLGGGDSAAVAAGLAAVAAAAELLGVRIRPQVRRQVPEPWRRSLPLSLATGLYGVLLGLGFATFVLTLAVVALAMICLALGDPVLGVVVGIGFGLGRLLPVVVLATAAERLLGVRLLELMAERPAALRGARAADGLALAACAVAIGAGDAQAARRISTDATDPSVAGAFLAWEQPGGRSFLHSGRFTVPLPGRDAAVGGPFVAWHDGDRVSVLRLADQRPVLTRVIPGVGDLTVSGRWLAYRRAGQDGGSVIGAVRLPTAGREHRVATSRSASALGRPDLAGDHLAYHVAGGGGSAIRVINLRTGRKRTVVRAREAQLLNPSLLGGAIVYVVAGRCSQLVVLRHHGHTRVLLRGRPLASQDRGFDPGHTPQGSRTPCARPSRTTRMFWTTALAPRWAYVAVIRPRADGTTSSLLMLRR